MNFTMLKELSKMDLGDFCDFLVSAQKNFYFSFFETLFKFWQDIIKSFQVFKKHSKRVYVYMQDRTCLNGLLWKASIYYPT